MPRLTINTLVADMNHVIDGNGGWDETIAKFFERSIGEVVSSRLNPEDNRPGTLRMSNLGSPCERKLWYTVNQSDAAEPLRPATKLKFLYGDMLEALILGLVSASGHNLHGTQDTLYIGGIKGHRDGVIDGITVDVKSASGYGFKKFKEGGLREDDPFGYLSQLSSYVYAGHRDTPELVHPTIGAFLVVNKENGEICLDLHDLSEEVKGKEQEVERLKGMVSLTEPPPRSFEPVADGKSGNEKLGVNCSYCAFKDTCWPGLQTFFYSNGPRFLTKVVRAPKVEGGV